MLKKLSLILLAMFLFALVAPDIADANRYSDSTKTTFQRNNVKSARADTRLNTISQLESSRIDLKYRLETKDKALEKIKTFNTFPKAEDVRIIKTETEPKKNVDTPDSKLQKEETKTEPTQKKVESEPVTPIKNVEKKVESTPTKTETTTTEVSHISKIEQLAFNAVNRYRTERDLSALVWNEKIAVVARKHSSDMAQGVVPFSHDGFNDRFKQIKTFLPIKTIAENVAYNYGYDDPASKAVEGWINSPGHLKNMVGDYNLSGLGVSKNTNGHYYLTQLFVK